MKNIIVVAIVSGQKKNGTGNWYRATLKGHNAEGKPVVSDFFLNEDVGEKAIRDGSIEDCPVTVNFGFDDYMRPAIIGFARVGSVVSTATSSSSSKVI